MLIAVLDDHPVIHEMIKRTVLDIVPSAELKFYTQLEDALHGIKYLRPDYVITDIQIFNVKQTSVIELCRKLEIPYMVYTSYVNISIIQACDAGYCMAYVAKSSPIKSFELGVKSLFNHGEYRCDFTKKYINRSPELLDSIPKVEYSNSELPAIKGQLKGETAEVTAKSVGKSANTIRNQRISLMHKNDCSMEEVARRYLYWHTEG